MNITIGSSDLELSRERFFDEANLQITYLQKESESEEYSAFRFKLNNKNICYREAKITPTKTGQFVTLWKRNQSGTIEPFDYLDDIDFVIVTVRKDQNWGQFIFPKKTLLKKGIFSTQSKEGIRATRVYPPWDETTSKQAQKTQKWQLDYFFNFSDQSKIDLKELKKIFV
ncbi:MepB family protein [Flavobacterium sp. UW10123]|uniref:MepB family protein n=1 Tax=Flavobacterium sp. UW10123 TaxID=3230800 RepID=UPI00339B2732